MNTSSQAARADQAPIESGVVYAIKVRRQWPRSLCAICRQPMNHADREFAVFRGDTGVLCGGCAATHAPELARALEHLYAPRHISGMDLGGLPIDVVVRAEMPLADVAMQLRALADAVKLKAGLQRDAT
ncbi:MAG: hypothetical protein ACM359_09455 [Bacillota bacterium]